jgi:hypothetical protein
MLPRLQAEGSLARVAEMQAADSQINAGHRRKLISGWQRLADIDKPRPARKKLSAAEYAAAMNGLGMKHG